MAGQDSFRWVGKAGLAHALFGIALVFAALHPLRDALDAHGLALVQTMATVQALCGIGLAALAPRINAALPAALIAGGVTLSMAMILVIAFTGLHPFDPAVPLGGAAMLFGWAMLLAGRGLE